MTKNEYVKNKNKLCETTALFCYIKYKIIFFTSRDFPSYYLSES